MSRDEVIETIERTGHSRFPFTPTGEIEDLTGIVLAKKLFNWMLSNDDAEIDWSAVCEDPLVVPEAVALPQLLRQFQDTRRHLAIVVDEYGSVEGLATLEDVLEEIVGDILDEHDVPSEDIFERPDGALIVRANTDLRTLCTYLGVSWQPDTAATVGGLVTESLERIPVVGDRIEWQGFEIVVNRADKRRATRLRISPLSH